MTEHAADARQVMAFYKFVAAPPAAGLPQVQDELQTLSESLGVKGTILLADEGINGTVVASRDALKQLRAAMDQHFGPVPVKYSELDADNQGFYRLKVRIKPEIVSFGVPDLDVANTGEHVSAQRWNELLADPNVVVIDTRNTYEIDIGTFPGAVSPETESFREFPAWVQDNLDPKQTPRVAMFCTGGIRCEKASAFMRQQGFDEVYQLDGGILQYLEDVPEQDNTWQGECFVFDQRVSVNAALEQGQYKQCYACRHPITADDMASPAFELGVSCPHCIDSGAGHTDPTRTERLRERQKQVELAVSRGEQHIGTHQKARKTRVSPGAGGAEE